MVEVADANTLNIQKIASRENKQLTPMIVCGPLGKDDQTEE